MGRTTAYRNGSKKRQQQHLDYHEKESRELPMNIKSDA